VVAVFTHPDEEIETLTYAHCYEDAEDGAEFGCGMEYEYDEADEVLWYWHDAVGQVIERPCSPAQWRELVAWHEATCLDRERPA
jgi:hypothetical protein